MSKEIRILALEADLNKWIGFMNSRTGKRRADAAAEVTILRRKLASLRTAK